VAVTRVEELLERHRPVLRYHSEELYGVVAVEAVTDFYFDSGPSAVRETQLRRRGEEIPIAEARPGAELVLRSTLLGSSYDGIYDATSDDYLDLHNLSYTADAAIAQQSPRHRDVIYATATERADRAGLWLQYWFFYTFNSKAARASNVGVHEGDWEMIQVRLDNSALPDEVTYAQHKHGQKAPWPGKGTGRDEVETIDERPVVYVALGSHASYFRRGRYPIEGLAALTWLIDDVADGDGHELSDPQLRVLPHDDPPTWASWPGRWGASAREPFASPTGPAEQGSEKWYTPDEFHAKASWFEELLLDTGESGIPPRPADVAVEVNGSRVVVSFTTPFDEPGLWSAELMLSSHQQHAAAPREEAYLVNGDVAEPPPIDLNA
jgi:hypothetical protein